MPWVLAGFAGGGNYEIRIRKLFFIIICTYVENHISLENAS